MKKISLENVQEAGNYPKVKQGGYICVIKSVEDVADKEYLKIEYDIASGDLKGYYEDLCIAKGFWGASFVKSYKESALPFFKGFITAVKNSNKGFVWHDDKPNDEKTLIGKLVGLVLGLEEYQANDGNIKERIYVKEVHSVDKIRNGDFEVPEGVKALTSVKTPTRTSYATNRDMPF